MKSGIINILFIIFILISLIGIPFLLFFYPEFSSLGLEHIFAIIVSFFSIFIVTKNQTIKRYFSESYEYLFIGIILLSGVHLSELVFEIIWKIQGEFGETLVLTLEHVFYYMGVLSISYSFFKVEEPSVTEKLVSGDEISKKL
ncbi:hypothetical protein HY249_00045 [Candidatus Azambacteria bacterium]|nr:hypothetical protein [Candidatus Azambacteria bacterium]